MGLAGNFILSFIGAFLGGWYVCENFIDPDSLGKKAMCGGFFSFVTLVMECVLFIIRDEKERKSRSILFGKTELQGSLGKESSKYLGDGFGVSVFNRSLDRNTSGC